MKKKLNRMWRQVTADKKKFGMLVTMMAVGLLLWGRLILLEDVPKIATADPNETGEAIGSAADKASPQGVQSTPTLPPLEQVSATLGEDLTLNLFAFRHNHYKPLPSENPRDTEVQLLGVMDDDRRQELVGMARSLRLQSVIQGNSPAIVINGEVLRVGDSVEGFELISFNERSAKLTREGLTFLLKMWSD